MGPRLRLRTLLVAVALAGVLCALAVPMLRLWLGSPNGWVVRTVQRPDGTLVRQRIRRYPNRDVVFEQVLRPGPGAPLAEGRPAEEGTLPGTAGPLSDRP